MLSRYGEAETEKSARTTVSGSEALCWPFVPVTVKLRGFAIVAERLLTVSTLVLPGWMEVGLNVQAAPELIVQVRAMPLVRLLGPAAPTVNVVVVLPTVTVDEVGPAGVTEKTATPVPVKATLWVVGLALSVRPKLPVRAVAPAPVGVKTMLNTQLDPALMVTDVVGPAPQPLVWAKSPTMAVLLMIKGALPVLVSVTVWGGLDVPTV
jgi:hypothetical protein